MSRESDWHVFDKAVEITAMAARGTAGGVTPAQVADIFREVHAALREVAEAVEAQKPAGF
jgi:phosphoribosylanthranilate isomerase